MLYLLLADLVLSMHAAFVLFVVFGGLFALKWPSVAWWHVPAALWGAMVEFTGWVCPLTPLENWLRAQAADPVYETDFISFFLLPILYPASLTPNIQIVLGSIVLLVNGAVYALLWRIRYYETRHRFGRVE
jgi:Protein of Unknown function (DUF2784)